MAKRRRRLSFPLAQLPVATRRLAFSVVLLAGGIVFPEAGGCARCGGEAANPAAAVAPAFFVPQTEPIFREKRPRRHASRTFLRNVEAAGGDYGCGAKRP